MDEEAQQNKSTMNQPLFQVWACGPFRIERRGEREYENLSPSIWQGRRSPRYLLKVLLSEARRQARRSTLLELLSSLQLSSPQNELSVALSILRQVLRVENENLLFIENPDQIYRLEGQAKIWVDADAAKLLVVQAEQVGRTTREALSLLQQAAQYFDRGPLFEGDTWPWLIEPRKALEEAHRQCLLWLAEAYTCNHQEGQAQSLLSTLLQKDPGNEDVLRRLMALLCQQEMPYMALKLFEETQALLQLSNRNISPAMLTYAEMLRNG